MFMNLISVAQSSDQIPLKLNGSHLCLDFLSRYVLNF